MIGAIVVEGISRIASIILIVPHHVREFPYNDLDRLNIFWDASSGKDYPGDQNVNVLKRKQHKFVGMRYNLNFKYLCVCIFYATFCRHFQF